MEKLKGKELGGQVSAAAVGAEGRSARKFAELEAGRVLVAQAARQAEETRERLEEEQREKKEKEREYRDTPKLSRQSKWFGLEEKQMEEDFRWTLEMEQELWEALKNWQPVPAGSISGDLVRLSKLYLALLEAILTHTTGEEQKEEIIRLDEVLMEKLNLLMEVRLKNLMDLLGQTGQTETARRIWIRFYKGTTGESPDPGKTEQFFRRRALGTEEGAGSGKMPVTGGVQSKAFQQPISGARAVPSEEGRLYRPSLKGGVEINRDFDAQRKSGEVQIGQRASALAGKPPFPEQEFRRAELFASHLKESSRLFESLGGTGGNEEAAGYFAALTFVKGQLYASGGGSAEARELAAPMESLIQRMVDYYLSSKGARRVYYYMTDLYRKTGDSQKTAKEGLSYALGLFQEKKGDSSFRNRDAYSEKEAFFPAAAGQSQEEALQRGLRLLEENWRSFQKALGGEEEISRISLGAQRLGSWAMLAEAERKRQEPEKKPDRALLRAAILAAAAGLFFLGWKVFSG